MKLKNLFFAAAAVLGLAVACQKQEDNVPAGITVDPIKIEADAAGKTQEVKVTSSEAWTVVIPTDAKEWLHVAPLAGNKGVSTITVTVDALQGKPRNSRINFMAGLFNASIAVSQTGTEVANDGKTPETAFTASEAYAWVMDNIKKNNDPSEEPFYVKGFIHKIGVYKEVEQYFSTNSYGNATFYMSDGAEYDPNAEKDFEAYQVNYLGNRKFDKDKDTDIKVGDEVIIFGYLTKYEATAETMQQNTGKGAYIYSLNGKVEEVVEDSYATPSGTGTEENPFNVSAAIAKAKETGSTATAESYYIRGKVSEISENFDGGHSNGTFSMVDEGYSAVFEAYRIKHFNNKPWSQGDPVVAEGDEVVICAKIVNYGNNKPETDGGYLYSLNGEKGEEITSAQPSGDGSEANPFNVAAAINAVKDLKFTDKDNYETVGPYYISGTVSSITEAYSAESNTFGNGTFVIVDEGYSASFIAYRVLYLQNKPFDKASDTDIKVGDKVVVYAKLMNYFGNTPETVQAGAYLYSLNGDTGTPDTSAQPSGTGTESDPFNVAGAVKKAKETGTTPTADEYYIKGIVKDDATIDATNKNVTLFLVDEGYDAVFQAYRIKSFGGADFFGSEQFKAGDEVVVKGKIVNYNESTPEIHFKPGEYNGQLVLINGKNSFGDVFSVESTEIPVGATATEAVIKVLSNVAWTAESSTATLDKSEGEGSAEIKVTFDANTDTENTKTYTVTLKTTAEVDQKEIVVTITQGKASSGNETAIEIDFKTCPDGFPSGSTAGLKDGTYTLGGYSFTFHAADKFYWNSDGYLLIGKQNSYIELPVVEGKALTKISFKTGSKASTSVIVDVTKEGTALNINTDSLDQGKEYEWEVPGEVGVAYRLQVMSKHNAQYQYLNLIYE